MDHSHQLCIFILSMATLFTDINPTGDFKHSWFDAQNHCLGQGLTIERDKSDQPYWTGVYRRLTPWINILGCFSDYIELLPDIVIKTMAISSVGMCQEICDNKNVYLFAVKMNMCLCIERDIRLSHFTRLSPSACNYTCNDNSDDMYSGDCGGEMAYNIFENQGIPVHLNSAETCLSLQCLAGTSLFIPQHCSNVFQKVCENMKLQDYTYASSWRLSMEECKRSQPSTYLLGDIDLNDPHLVCALIPLQFYVFWVGVARLMYISIDQGLGIKEEQIESFLECQVCGRNGCQFRDCFDLVASSIFCKTISDSSQGKTTSQIPFSSSILMLNHSTSKDLFASRSTTENYDKVQLQSTNDGVQKAGASDDLVLKISLPLTVGFITLLLCVVGVMLYKRRDKMTTTDRTTNAEVQSVSEKQVYSELDFSESNSSFALEHCYQKISKRSNSLNESPYNNSIESVGDHLKVKQAQERVCDNIYQNASTDITGDTSGYDTITYNKHQEEDASYDYLQTDANDTYRCDESVSTTTDNPYDNAV